jgi:type IV pilus assembly protein PilM
MNQPNAAMSLASLLKDPPPTHAFELSEDGVAFARVAEPRLAEFRSFQPGVLVVSPVNDNLQQPHVLLEHIHSLVPPNGHRKRRAALILPDYCARVAVLDFDAFPTDPHEQLALLRFRMKKSVPFDVDSAVVSFVQQPRRQDAKVEVLTAVISSEIVGQYEAPFRAAGFHPGLITTSSLAALNLVAPDGITLLVKLSGHILSVLVLDGSTLKLVRCVQMDEAGVDGIESVLHPTIAYVEDELKALPKHIWLGGFGPQLKHLADRWRAEWNIEVGALESGFGSAMPNNTGLLGYLESVAG